MPDSIGYIDSCAQISNIVQMGNEDVVAQVEAISPLLGNDGAIPGGRIGFDPGFEGNGIGLKN